MAANSLLVASIQTAPYKVVVACIEANRPESNIAWLPNGFQYHSQKNLLVSIEQTAVHLEVDGEIQGFILLNSRQKGWHVVKSTMTLRRSCQEKGPKTKKPGSLESGELEDAPVILLERWRNCSDMLPDEAPKLIRKGNEFEFKYEVPLDLFRCMEENRLDLKGSVSTYLGKEEQAEGSFSIYDHLVYHPKRPIAHVSFEEEPRGFAIWAVIKQGRDTKWRNASVPGCQKHKIDGLRIGLIAEKNDEVFRKIESDLVRYE